MGKGGLYKINSCRSTITKFEKSISYSSLLNPAYKNNDIKKIKEGAYLPPPPDLLELSRAFLHLEGFRSSETDTSTANLGTVKWTFQILILHWISVTIRNSIEGVANIKY